MFSDLILTSPTKAHGFESFVPRCGTLVDKVMEPLGDGDLLEEICLWGLALGFSSLTPLPTLFLLLECRGNVTDQLHAHVIMLSLPVAMASPSY